MIEPSPGSALMSPPTTLRSEGTTEISRRTRRMRRARSTVNGPDAGMSAMATIEKSKIDHGSRKKRQPKA